MENQLQTLKLNVTNINSYLVQSNNQLVKLRKKRISLLNKLNDQEKSRKKEKKLEAKDFGLGKGVKKIAGSLMSPAMSLFDKIKELFGIVVLGFFINTLPKIIRSIRNFLNSDFVKTIKNIFSLVLNAATGLYDIATTITQSAMDTFERTKKDIETQMKNVGGVLSSIQKFFFGEDSNESEEQITSSQSNASLNNNFTGIGGPSLGPPPLPPLPPTKKDRGFNVPNFFGLGKRKGSSSAQLGLTDQDFSDLAFIVSHEAIRNTDDEYGVAAAVLNRVADPRYPNTIMGVGTAPDQFEAVFKGLAYRDPELAQKLKDNQDKIIQAMRRLGGRTDFKGQTMLKFKGSSDIMFHPKGNFYHYPEQIRKSDPVPQNIPEYYKKRFNISSITPRNRDLNVAMSEGSSTVVYAIQPVNNYVAVPYPVPVKQKVASSRTTSVQMAEVWRS